MADQNEKVSAPQGGMGAILVGGSPAGKTAWPEVVGLAAEAAEKKIKEDAPHVRVQLVPPGNFVTMDFDQRRVRLYLDSAGLVAREARLG